jgi:hypothetical protein
MGKLLCKLGLHSWQYNDRWVPSFTARIVTQYSGWLTCRRCGKTAKYFEENFDPITGQCLGD